MSKNNTSKKIATKINTKIWSEIPKNKSNPFAAETFLCHGYNFYEDLLGKFTWLELFYLLLKGELPDRKTSDILNILMSSIIDLGPRHWATHAAMTAAVTHTTVGNSLMSGLAVLQGRLDGALCVEKSMIMTKEINLCATKEKDFHNIYLQIANKYSDLPGYGLYFCEKDKRVEKLLEILKSHKFIGKSLKNNLKFEKIVLDKKGIGLTLLGVFSISLTDLGFNPKEGHGIYLLSAAPGLLAHLLEQMEGDWNTFPFFEPPEYQGATDIHPEENQNSYDG